MKKKIKEQYFFLDSTVYSPKEIEVGFGCKVTIDKRNGDEVWFSFVDSKQKGYVVYPNLFCKVNELNEDYVQAYINHSELAKQHEKKAYQALNKIKTLK